MLFRSHQLMVVVFEECRTWCWCRLKAMGRWQAPSSSYSKPDDTRPPPIFGLRRLWNLLWSWTHICFPESVRLSRVYPPPPRIGPAVVGRRTAPPRPGSSDTPHRVVCRTYDLRRFGRRIVTFRTFSQRSRTQARRVMHRFTSM